MPKTIHISDLLLNGGDPYYGDVKKITVKVREEDDDLIRNVFPEGGVPTYLTGLFYRLLADHLREENILDFATRLESKKFENVVSLTTHIQVK